MLSLLRTLRTCPAEAAEGLEEAALGLLGELAGDGQAGVTGQTPPWLAAVRDEARETFRDGVRVRRLAEQVGGPPRLSRTGVPAALRALGLR